MSREHIHEWGHIPEDGTYYCVACPETTPVCNTCAHPVGTALLICGQCLNGEAWVLEDIMAALETYQSAPPPILKAARYDRDMVHGGSFDGLPFNVDVRLGIEERTSNTQWPRDIVEWLMKWARMWAKEVGDAATWPPADYLRAHLIWAGQNVEASEWDDYRDHVRRLRWEARRMAGLLPQREAVPCVHCGGRIVRDWANPKWEPRSDGLSDVVRCSGCGMTWEDRTKWDYVNHLTLRALPESKMGTLVTLEDARLIYPHVPADAIRKWMQRDREADVRQVPERGWDVRGVPVYRLGDLDALVTRRADETRRGPKASERIGA